MVFYLPALLPPGHSLLPLLLLLPPVPERRAFPWCWPLTYLSSLSSLSFQQPCHSMRVQLAASPQPYLSWDCKVWISECKFLQAGDSQSWLKIRIDLGALKVPMLRAHPEPFKSEYFWNETRYGIWNSLFYLYPKLFLSQFIFIYQWNHHFSRLLT